jgi:hypothetical protein
MKDFNNNENETFWKEIEKNTQNHGQLLHVHG